MEVRLIELSECAMMHVKETFVLEHGERISTLHAKNEGGMR
jgi:hypothetical protein